MKLTVKEITVFSMLGALMYGSKVLMEALPNVHLLAVLTIAYTIVYRQKALYPIYVCVMLIGLFAGFSTWWIPHLYLWLILWAVIMALPKKLPKKAEPIIYMVICSLHGFLYGIMYAPAQAILFGLDFKGMLTWIAAGFSFDMIHGVSNFICGVLILPIVGVLRKAERFAGKQS